MLSENQKAIRKLWERGNLSWKLHEGQLPIRDMIYRAETVGEKKVGARTSRRFGKTYAFVGTAAEYCLREKNIIVPYCAPSIKALKTIILPIAAEIFRDCPAHLRPVLRRQDGAYWFPSTDSQILLVSAENGNEEKARGIKARVAFVDEGGVIKELKYLINDILLPTLMYSSGAIALSGTPPTTPDHYYVEFMADCDLKGFCQIKTVWDNPMLANKEILQFAEAVGCIINWRQFNEEHCKAKMFDRAWAQSLIIDKSTTFQREFEAAIIIDPEKAVIPEFTEARAAEMILEWQRPEFCHKYTIIDTGFIDYTGVIFGYYDFRAAKVVVEDDLLLDFAKSDMTAEKAANMILAKERELWGKDKPFLRFADGDLIVLREFGVHGLTVQPVRKDILEAQVNSLRVDIAQNKLVIHPRAKNTIAHTKYAVWNKQRNKFDRGEGMGHYDCLAALIYFVRHINRSNNPYPAFSDFTLTQSTWIPEKLQQEESSADSALKRIFKR